MTVETKPSRESEAQQRFQATVDQIRQVIVNGMDSGMATLEWPGDAGDEDKAYMLLCAAVSLGIDYSLVGGLDLDHALAVLDDMKDYARDVAPLRSAERATRHLKAASDDN